MSDDRQLDVRLGSLEARIPGAVAPDLEHKRRHVRLAGRSAVAAVLLLLATVATTAAIAVVVSGGVRGYPGIENPGQPLAGAQMECMSPPQAAAYLAAHGFNDVVWQVESGGTGRGEGTTTFVTTPPAHGYVIPGAILDDGKLHVIVDQRGASEGTGACHGMPMP